MRTSKAALVAAAIVVASAHGNEKETERGSKMKKKPRVPAYDTDGYWEKSEAADDFETFRHERLTAIGYVKQLEKRGFYLAPMKGAKKGR